MNTIQLRKNGPFGTTYYVNGTLNGRNISFRCPIPEGEKLTGLTRDLLPGMNQVSDGKMCVPITHSSEKEMLEELAELLNKQEDDVYVLARFASELQPLITLYDQGILKKLIRIHP